ncbi:hypothetical protein EST38_g7011 [Candolleomyces aberdarensis]|uniref:Nephrocystin 3-like N-terminal domain-containing protein n=1 Tax=Candolleomyces aberdarensis TaxID=2316362 RepID=A0A4Q2DG93_9AGAR|nr:hypothetical protein EST38_g7011 [Candolleomyces aberdarensis]
MANIEYFSHSQGVQAQTLKFVTNISSPSGIGPLKELESRIAPEALDDSAERCDAPKCHPETRVALQDDLYSWIEGEDTDNPHKMKWVTGPAGTGKTAVMGSLTERCKKNGFPVASFFFSSTGSIGRRTKTAFVTTIAHQLTQHRQDLKDAIAAAIEADTIVFKKNLYVQMETLVLAPLREIADECEVEKVHDTTTEVWTKPTRRNKDDQLEILQTLHQAVSDSSFPFRILIASRPERVFREFFNPENDAPSFAQKLDLHEDYNADADITLFLWAKFNRIRRRYNLPPSWPPPEAIEILVANASGQFIYVSTIIRFIDDSPQAPPNAQLEWILKMRTTPTSNPLRQLDLLYSHVLHSSPDPSLSVRWIYAINLLYSMYTARRLPNVPQLHALNMNLLFEKESGEAEYSLGSLHSLIQIPPSGDQATTRYAFYHKSLLDFLKNPDRCGKFAYSDVLPTPASADWWVSLAITLEKEESLWAIFREVHASDRSNSQKERFLSLVNAIKDTKESDPESQNNP